MILWISQMRKTGCIKKLKADDKVVNAKKLSAPYGKSNYYQSYKTLLNLQDS